MNKLFQVMLKDSITVGLLSHQGIEFHVDLLLCRMGLPNYDSSLCGDLEMKNRSMVARNRNERVLKDLLLQFVLFGMVISDVLKVFDENLATEIVEILVVLQVELQFHNFFVG